MSTFPAITGPPEQYFCQVRCGCGRNVTWNILAAEEFICDCGQDHKQTLGKYAEGTVEERRKQHRRVWEYLEQFYRD